MDFQIIRTNIINVNAEAIVLPANSFLKEGKGSSEAIFKAAGRKRLTQACSKIGFCEVGSAVPTLAYNLNAKYIIHAVVPKWLDGNHNEYELLCTAYLSALNLADYLGCESIAFPLLASGNNGYDSEFAFRIANESFNRFEGKKLQTIILVIYSEHIARIAKNQGLSVIDIPDGLLEEEKKLVHKKKAQKIVADGKEMLQDYLEEQIQKAIDYLKDPENRKKVADASSVIIKTIIAIIKR